MNGTCRLVISDQLEIQNRPETVLNHHQKDIKFSTNRLSSNLPGSFRNFQEAYKLGNVFKRKNFFRFKNYSSTKKTQDHE